VLKPKILVVYKKSVFSRCLSCKQPLHNLKKYGYWGVVSGSHGRHHAALRTVQKALSEEGLEWDCVLRSGLQRLGKLDRKYQCVVTVGGDGTFLDASHHVSKIPVLGVNSDPPRSVARFSGCDETTFLDMFRKYLYGLIRPLPTARLEFFINGRRQKWLVLNDLLIAASNPAGTSRYLLRAKGKSENQLSSGVWISTAAGSTAANLSAGGRPLSVTERRFQFVVREAYRRPGNPYHLLKGVLNPSQTLQIVSYMPEGCVFVDGSNLAVPFRLGDRLLVRYSKYPLNVIGLKKIS
jgi:NAD+ kinase